MRVAVVTTSYPASAGDPAGHFVRAECQALIRQGYSVTVFAPAPQEPATNACSGTSSEPRVVWLPAGDAFGFPGALNRLAEDPTRALHAIRFALGCRQALLDWGPWTRVIAHWLLPCAWPIAVTLPWPIETIAHGSDVRLLAKHRRLGGWVLRQLAARGTQFRCVSSELARTLLGIDPELEASVRVEPCALDIEGVPSRYQAREELGIVQNASIAVVVGRVVGSKRVDVALQALSLLPALNVIVIGDGPMRSALEERFPQVRFTGALPRLHALTWIAASDLLVSASLEEGAPSVIREARGLGVPAVCRPCGDVLEWAAIDPELYVAGSAC